MKENWSFNTKAIHYGQNLDKNNRAVSQSVIPAVAYSFESAEEAAAVVMGKEKGIYYGRYGNPTTQVLEEKIATLEGAEDALGVSSGMAAISISLLAFVGKGDHVVVTKDIYGGTHKFLTNFGPKFGIEFDFVDCNKVHEIIGSIKENTRAIYIETPSNPKLTILDIEEISSIAKDFNIPLIVDNTFMTPYLQKPLKLGADIVIHSATKYLNGHGDVIAGFICGEKQTIKNMRKNIMGDLGQSLNAWESFLILRGLKTLGIRMKQHCSNAKEIVSFLKNHPLVEKIYYPGLNSHPQYDIAKKQMKEMGGIISFEIKGDIDSCKKFMKSLNLLIISFSLGDPETLIQHPASMTHSSIPEESLEDFGISKNLIRLSVGLEDPKDIINDLKQAFLRLEQKEVNHEKK